MDSFLRDQRIQLQLWDKDVGLNDMLGGATLSLMAPASTAASGSRDVLAVEEGELVEMIVYKTGCRSSCTKRTSRSKFGGEGVGLQTLLEGRAIAGADDLRPPSSGSLRDSDGGRAAACSSMELVPASSSDTPPGMAAPSPPVLPKPTGRIKFSLNPFRICHRLLGPKLCKRMGGMHCALCIVLFVYYVLPVIVGTSIANLFTG